MSATLAPPPDLPAPAVSPVSSTPVTTAANSPAGTRSLPLATQPRTALLAIACCGVFLALASGRLWHTDLWDHLNYGKFILQQQAVPLSEPLLPLAAGTRMVNIPWLAQISMKLTERHIGLAGLQLLAGGCGAFAVFLTAYEAARRTRSAFAGLLAITVFILVNQHELQVIRPQLAGLLGYCITLAWTLGTQKHSLKHWIGFTLLFALWANLHGSFAMGLTLLAIAACGRALDVLLHSRSAAIMLADPQFHRNILLLQLCSVAVLLNPNGLLIYPEIFAVSGHPNTASMFEWQPLTLRMPHGQIAATVLAITVLCVRFSPRRLRTTEILAFCGTALMAAWSARMLNWWAPVAAIVVATHLTAILRPVLSRFNARQTARPSLLYTVGCLAVAACSVALTPLGAQLRTGTPPAAARLLSKETPIALAAFLRSQQDLPRGTAWVPAEWAGFLMNQTQGSLKSMVNLHVHLIPEEVWRDYLRVAAGSADWVNLLDEYGVNLVVVDKRAHSLLLKRIRESADWKSLYDDRQSVLLLRRQPL